jgi:hypothetical protein
VEVIGNSETEVREALAAIAAGGPQALEAAGLPATAPSILDRRTLALARLAVSFALDAPPATYGRQVAEAIDVGVLPAELLALLRAVTPQIGAARSVAAAPELMLALGLSLPGTPDPRSER